MKLYGKEIKKSEITKCVGDISQIADAKECVLTDGRADGVKAIEVKTGSGLCFTVLPSRGLDIAWANYKGMAVSYIGKPGVVAPEYYEKDGIGFLRSFFAGLLTTCGLTYMGGACCDNGEELGLHGRISNIPAEEVGVVKEWIGDDYVISIRGKVRQARVFGENIVLTRKIEVKMGGKSIKIKDVVENCGFEEQPFMLLDHINFGYPIVSEDTVLVRPEGGSVKGSNENCNVKEHAFFTAPVKGFAEEVFYHDIPKVKGDETYACLFNEKLNIGAYVKYNKEQFPYLNEWKMLGEGEYVVGLEPGTWVPEGRAAAREKGALEFIQPGETRTFEYEIGVIEDKKELEDIF